MKGLHLFINGEVINNLTEILNIVWKDQLKSTDSTPRNNQSGIPSLTKDINKNQCTTSHMRIDKFTDLQLSYLPRSTLR